MGAGNRVGIGLSYRPARARIFKLIRSPRLDSKEPIPPGCVAWRAGTTTLLLLGPIPIQPGEIGSLESILGLLKSLEFGLWRYTPPPKKKLFLGRFVNKKL
jgi:hypothetical protein